MFRSPRKLLRPRFSLEAVIRARRTVRLEHVTREVVVYDATVDQCLSEDLCGAIVDVKSGRKSVVEYDLRYEPERVCSGEKELACYRILKVVSRQNSDL